LPKVTHTNTKNVTDLKDLSATNARNVTMSSDANINNLENNLKLLCILILKYSAQKYMQYSEIFTHKC